MVKSGVSTVRYANAFGDIRSIFSTLVTEEMINLIVEKTNKRLEIIINRCADKIANNSRCGFIRKTHATEIYALIGFVYLRGLLRQNNHSQKYLFRDKMGHPLFPKIVLRYCLVI